MKCSRAVVSILMLGAAMVPGAAQDTCSSESGPRSTSDPGEFIQIFENNGKREKLIYDARSADPKQQLLRLKVDSQSSIVARIVPDRLDCDVAINQVAITATLASGDKNTPIQVIGYSMIGQDQETGKAQTAVSIQTVGQIRAMMENFYWTARDILAELAPECRTQIEEKPEAPLPAACRTVDPAAAAKAMAVYRNGEAKAITGFFADAKNVEVVRFLGENIFGMDAASLQAVATAFTTDLDGLFSSTASSEQKQASARSILQRIALGYRDIRVDYHEKKGNTRLSEPAYIRSQQKQIVETLKKNLVPGQINLGVIGSKEGDRVRLQVESKAIGRNGTSAARVFDIEIHDYGFRTGVSPSFFLIRRIGVTEADQGRGLTSVRFAPSPGVTYGFTYTGRDGVWNTLAPGLGANLSFMNFNDPRDFDPSTGKFKNTTSVNVQFGAGFTVSLFHNMLQGTYGWNLNADRKREYWGLGFGFLDIAKYFANHFGK